MVSELSQRLFVTQDDPFFVKFEKTECQIESHPPPVCLTVSVTAELSFILVSF